MKYVMFRVRIGDDLVKLVPVIFPNELVHSMVAEALTQYRDNHGDVVIDGKPVSAGELSVDAGTCHGISTTLGLSPRPDDSQVINTIDYAHGIVDILEPEILEDGPDVSGLEPELAADVQALYVERNIAENEARFRANSDLAGSFGRLADTLRQLQTLTATRSRTRKFRR